MKLSCSFLIAILTLITSPATAEVCVSRGYQSPRCVLTTDVLPRLEVLGFDVQDYNLFPKLGETVDHRPMVTMVYDVNVSTNNQGSAYDLSWEKFDELAEIAVNFQRLVTKAVCERQSEYKSMSDERLFLEAGGEIEFFLQMSLMDGSAPSQVPQIMTIFQVSSCEAP